MELIKNEILLFGCPIKNKDLGTIYQPTLKDFIDNNLDMENFIGIFNIKAEELFQNSDNIKDFDVFTYQLLMNAEANDLLIIDLIRNLKFLYKTNDINIEILNKNLDSICISIKIDNKKHYINRDNYNELVDIILVMIGIKDNIIEIKEQRELSPIELQMEKKRKEFERKKRERNSKKEKNGMTFFDLANYIIHADGSKFDYQSVLNLTLYQIKNTFHLYNKKETYKTEMDYRTSGQFKLEEKTEHWFQKK